MIKIFLPIVLLITTTCLSQDIDFTYGADWHFEHKLQSVWQKADATGDGIITIKDKGGWWHNRAKDANQDGQVTIAEFKTPLPLQNAGKTYSNVVYKEATGEQCLLDIYLPKAKKAGSTPVFYFTHGGGWAAGNKDLSGNMKAVFEAMLAEGIACVSTAYRLVRSDKDHPVVMADCVTDCKDGLRFIAKHAAALDLDMDRVCVFGNSAGGHICLMLAYSSPASFPGDPALSDYQVRPAAGINWYGPFSFLQGDLFIHPMAKPFQGNPNRFAGRMSKAGQAVEYIDAPETQQALMEKLSPITYYAKDSVPVLTIHGDKDTTIPHMHSELMVARAKELGADNVTYLAVGNAGHGFKEDSIPSFTEIKKQMVAFVLENLKKQ